MKKTFMVLLVAAVAVWGWVVAQFLSGYLGGSAEGPVLAQSGSLQTAIRPASARPALDTSFRDPFLSYLYAQKPAPVKLPTASPAQKRPALVVIEPPRAVLSGILWGDPPVAILKQEGATELVKEGAEAFGLKVQRIERHQVTVVKQGRKFVLGY